MGLYLCRFHFIKFLIKFPESTTALISLGDRGDRGAMPRLELTSPSNKELYNVPIMDWKGIYCSVMYLYTCPFSTSTFVIGEY